MKTVQLEDSVYDALAKHVTGFNDTPNDVIVRLLAKVSPPPTPPVSPSKQSTDSPLQRLLASPDFQRSDAIDRYLAILSFLYRQAPEKFELLEVYRRKGGKRVNFSKDINKIEESGNSTFPKRVPGTPFFVLTNLDNNSKRSILEDIMPGFGFSGSEIKLVQQEIPDSGISRSNVRAQLLASL